MKPRSPAEVVLIPEADLPLIRAHLDTVGRQRLTELGLYGLHMYLNDERIPLDTRLEVLDTVHREDIIWAYRQTLRNSEFDARWKEEKMRDRLQKEVLDKGAVSLNAKSAAEARWFIPGWKARQLKVEFKKRRQEEPAKKKTTIYKDMAELILKGRNYWRRIKKQVEN